MDCSVRGCNRKLYYCAFCHRAYVIVTEPDWTLGEHGLMICHMVDKVRALFHGGLEGQPSKAADMDGMIITGGQEKDSGRGM